MSTYIERMSIELDQLKDRAQKLITFLDTPAYDALSDLDECLLFAQAEAMLSYAFFLSERLQRAQTLEDL